MDVLQQQYDIRRDQHIEGWNVRLYYWTRDLQVLGTIAFLIIAISAGIAWQMKSEDPIGALLGKPHEKFSLRAELSKTKPDFPKIITTLRLERFDATAVRNSLAVSDL